MPTGFDEAFRRIKELVADFRDNEKFYLSPKSNVDERKLKPVVRPAGIRVFACERY